MSALAPTLEAFFTQRLIARETPARAPSPRIATRSDCCCATPRNAPASSHHSWISQTSTRR